MNAFNPPNVKIIQPKDTRAFLKRPSPPENKPLNIYGDLKPLSDNF